VDLSEVLIAVARQRTPPTDPVEFHVGDAARLAWSDASFDGSRADRILMFMEQPHQAVREMVRVTRPGGRIVVGEFDMETAIVDSPYRALTRKILDFWCDTIPNGWIGRQLLGLFQELGLRNVRVVPLLMRLTAYAQWNDVFQIETTVRRAVRGNVVSADEAEMWLRNLHEQDVRGRFCLCVSLFLVVGEKG
jgi:ubiquinone/menaquinone biosynthesis C-methylase UbiE